MEVVNAEAFEDLSNVAAGPSVMSRSDQQRATAALHRSISSFALYFARRPWM